MAREKLSFIDGKHGPTIWYSAAAKSLYDKSEGGMMEYSIKQDKLLDIIEYTDNMGPCRQCVCNHKNQIFIIDGENGEILLFDTISRTFAITAFIPNIGTYPSAVIMFDKIHIFHGDKNTNQHITYNIATTEVKVHTVPTYDNHKRDFVASSKYKNKLIRFGGFDNDPERETDLFFISNSSKIKPDTVNPPKWIMKEEWTLPRPAAGFGYALYQDYVVIFGGTGSGAEFSDKIYLLYMAGN